MAGVIAHDVEGSAAPDPEVNSRRVASHEARVDIARDEALDGRVSGGEEAPDGRVRY